MKAIDDWLAEALEIPESDRDAFVENAPEPVRNELRSALSSYIQATGFFDRLARDLQLPSTRSVNSDPATLAGREIAHYRILEQIGEGGMGAVYRAEDTRLGRTVALKFLPQTPGGDSRARERFVREAQSASALDHPNICTIFEIGEVDDRSYIAMACYDGQTIEDMIERGPLDVDSALDLTLQIASGLAAAHAKGIVHRDMKPANVMVVDDGLAKILDFGLAKGAGDATVTQEGAVIGTAAYMSPEQATGKPVDHRTDIWALGAMLYEMLSGNRPFPGAYPQAVLYGILNADPEPLSGLRSGLPLQLVESVEQALQKDPDRRFTRMQEFIDALESVRARAEAKSEARMLVADAAPGSASAAPTDSSPTAAAVDDDVLHILCVDDEPELELLMQQRFRKKIRAGEWKFEFALDGQDALQKLDAHPEIGLILTDLNMPRMDGLTLLGRLAEKDRPMRTVVVSAYGDLEKIRTAMNRGAFDFVTKPIDFKDLEATIDKAALDLSAFRRALRGQQQAVSIQQEMDVARRIQDATIPIEYPSGTFGFSTPAGEISSTFYDAFAVGDSRVALVAGDVGMRGVTATLLLAMGQTFVKGLLQQGVGPADALSMLNRMLFADGLPNLRLQIVVAIVNTADGAIEVANAGHQAPMILRAAGSVDSVDEAAESVWADTDTVFDVSTGRLDPGDVLILPSRGCVDVTGQSGRPFTVERLAATLRDSDDTRPTAVIRDVLRSIDDHVGTGTSRQDLTLVAMRRDG
jgi:serine/threonine protein kinase/serine phosphatase RsbU (regulator of sigma subunit)